MNVGDSNSGPAAVQDELLARAVEAVNRGDLKNAHALAEQVLEHDSGNLDARTLLSTESQSSAEMRRIAVMFCDLVGSTSLSSRLDPELYRGLISRYHKLVASVVVERQGGFVVGSKGDGVLALFGYPTVHENDTERGVLACLEIVSEVQALSDQIADTIGEPLAVRAALHRGLLYVDPEAHDVFGLAANIAARLQELAEPGQVVVSDAVRLLVADRFDIEPGATQFVKGVELQLQPFTVVGRRASQPIRAIRTPLVGRAAELAQLRSMWASAVASASSTVAGVTIIGEGGIGKSRLLAAISEDVTTAGATTVALAGSPNHHDVGFHPLRRLIETRCGISAGSTASDQLAGLEQELTSLGFAAEDTVPLIAPILGLDAEAGYIPADANGQKLTEDIAKAAVEYLLACCGNGPALLVVDDHHFMDEATDDLIRRVLESGRPQTFVLAASRTGPVRGTDQMPLGPLAYDACLALVDAIAPAEVRAKLDRSDLIARSDGVPLFLEELVRGSVHEPIEVGSRSARHVASSVPDVLYEPLTARLYTSPATVAVASVAATIGREVDLALLAQCVELPGQDLEAAIDVLLGALILEWLDDERQAVRFHHDLVWEVAYDLISPSRRREVHARVADALIESAENDERSDWTIIARHLERADRPADAAKAWREAAEDARLRGLLGEARLRMGAALDQAALLPAGPERNQLEVELRLQRGFLAASVEGTASAEAAFDFERCLELTLEIPHAPNLVSTLIALWGYYVSRGDLARAREASVIVESIVSEDWGEFRRPQNIAGFGMLDWWAGDFDNAARRLQEGIDLLYERENFDTEVVAAWYIPLHPTVAMHVILAVARFMVGDTVGADEHGQRAMDAAADLSFPQGPYSEAYTRWYLAWMYMERGDYDRSVALVTGLAELGEEHGFDLWSLVAMTQHAATAISRDAAAPGSTSTGPGQAVLGSLVSAWRAVELRMVLSMYITMVGRLAAKGGDTTEALTRYEESLELARETGMHFYDAETMRCRAHLAGQTDQVILGLSDALDVARQQGARPFELRIALDLYDIRGEAAAPELRAAVDGFQPDATYLELDEARARLARLGR
jgi:class 3 adenylate cyclase/tetratricopeptide (TPR) repeat protein